MHYYTMGVGVGRVALGLVMIIARDGLLRCPVLSMNEKCWGGSKGCARARGPDRGAPISLTARGERRFFVAPGQFAPATRGQAEQTNN